MGIAWEFTDYLDECNVFTNGLNGEPAHMDAYLTVCDFTRLEAAIEAWRGRYTLAQWQAIVADFAAHGYLSPMETLVSKVIGRLIAGAG